MMDPNAPRAWLAVAVLSTTLVAAPKRIPNNIRSSSEEPFRSFRMLDAKLTLLAKQLDALKASSNPMPAGSRGTAARRITTFRSMNSTTAEIGRIAGALERLYQKRQQPFGMQVFKVLRMRADEVQRGVNVLAKAQTASAVDLAAKRLDERIVSLVVQFQAASGGYGAARCSPGAWTCCEPKRSRDLLQSERVACMWGCVPTPQTCTGFLGPRIRRR